MRALVVIAAAVLAGCALKAPITHTELVDQALPQGTHIPPSWKAARDTGRVEDDWLKSFNDPMLDAIVAEAIANNLDLSQAADRVLPGRMSSWRGRSSCLKSACSLLLPPCAT